MKVYLVGGAVRDIILGRQPKDVDYVVVGATHDDMINEGFQRVGAAFPVYIHPVTGDEYALARTERKIGVGYNGFDVVADPSVTLEQDLARRDLTINSMALDQDTGKVIDPYGGQYDLARGILRHTSEAFAEDPVRVLRTARFAARYNFTVDDDTVLLMAKVVEELDHVPHERIYAEFEKGIAEPFPALMFNTLFTSMHSARYVKALEPWHQAWNSMPYNKSRFIECQDPDIRMATVLSCARPGFDKLPVPTRLLQIASDVCTVTTSQCSGSTAQVIDALTALRAFNSRDRLDNWMAVNQIIRGNIDSVCQTLNKALEKAKLVDTTAIAASCATGDEIKEAIRSARIAAAAQ